MKKMGKIIITLCLMFLVNFVSAQDTIVKKTGEEIIGEITLISSSKISYIIINKPNSTYDIPIKDVSMIKYKNGIKKIFNDTTNLSSKKIETLRLDGNGIYNMKNELLNYSEVLNLMKDYPDAYKHMKKAKFCQTASIVAWGSVVLVGSACVIIGKAELATENYDNHGFYTLAGATVGLFAIACIIEPGYKKNLRKAVISYNSNSLSSKSSTELYFKAGLGQNGLSMIINF